MGSQFVDFNADGLGDFLTATYEGAVYVALGLGDDSEPQKLVGFAEPEHLLDEDGGRIGLEMMWKLEGGGWKDVFGPQATTAVAFDWDADGDLDLLMGCYNTGNVYLRRNGGEAGEPAFGLENEAVLAGGKPFARAGGVTALRLLDWDADGLTDIVCGSFGAKDRSVLGGVYFFRNEGKVGAPSFAAPVALIAPLADPDGSAPSRGLYVDPVDYDGDGDLDLVVGGYSETKSETGDGFDGQAGVWLYRRK